MRSMNGDDVTEAVAGCLAALRPAVDRDWTAVPAGRLEWDCRTTAVHVADDLVAYASNLVARAQDDYVPFLLTPDEGTGNAGLLQVIEATGGLLAAAVDTAPPGVRAYHNYPYGSADRAGFAAMGIAEVLLHTHDMTQGLGLPYEPSADLAESVLSWLFPHVQPGPEPWPTLLWATGRGELPGRAPVTEWRWRNNLVIPAERLDLVGIRPAVAEDLSLGGDGGFEWVDGGPYEGTREAAGFMLKAYRTGVHRPEFGVFTLVRRDDGRAIGGMGFHSAPDEEGRVEIGYDLAESARGNGYATEALRALAEWALAREEVRTLFATIEPANTASQAVVSRAGFTKVSEDEEGLAYELRR
ncbi:GNAT family N-acetyltransferase [Streptomyces lavenduligriseus]|uniref:GNAT family N-acetyltransferase n=1 Tax=Streptomyces lavenduligriseus TaxID=67315 RepID=A0ABT0NRS2_9ACTN|nr:GNAT family N-acetyltransferase [Streptomyces lavenduligriseus]MCL3994152.1 GNAT family N-acetyltransferase [Streptomyces lavenduligriseus]